MTARRAPLWSLLLQLTVHHVAFDGASTAVLLGELDRALGDGGVAVIFETQGTATAAPAPAMEQGNKSKITVSGKTESVKSGGCC